MSLTEKELLPCIRMARLYDTEKAGVFKQTKQRRLDCYELGLYLNDGGFLEINGEQKTIHRGDIRFGRPGDQISSIPPYRCYTIFFSFAEGNGDRRSEFLEGIPGYFHAENDHQDLFEQTVAMFESQELGSVVMQNAILLQLLYQCYHERHVGKKYCEKVMICVEYMHAHIDENITLDTLGAISGYSPLHIRRLFLRDTLCSPHEFLSRVRITEARKLLVNSSLTVGQIAIKCGFTSESYFQMLFKKVNGCTPGEYRRNARVF